MFRHRMIQRDGVYMMGKQSGVTLLELMVVCAILAIISAIAIPNIMQMNRNYKLDGAGHIVASLLQQARMQAVKTNQPTYTKYDPVTSLAFVTSDPRNAYANGNPDVVLPGGLSFNGVPQNHAQLDAYVAAGGLAPHINVSIGFNARGLPCIANGGNAWDCPRDPAGFEWFVQNPNGGWVAITVTPSGRVKVWHLSNAANGTWQ